jgi:four helix bundle protein
VGFDTLEDLEIFRIAEKISDRVYELVQMWPPLAQDTVGKQLIRATDSIGANIAESFGRYHYGEKLNFIYYARGSIYEAKFWIRRVQSRKLLTEERCLRALSALDELTLKINAFISDLRRRRRMASGARDIAESSLVYSIEQLSEEVNLPDHS